MSGILGQVPFGKSGVIGKILKDVDLASNLILSKAGGTIYLGRASDASQIHRIYSDSGSNLKISSDLSSGGSISFVPSSSSGTAMTINAGGNVAIGRTTLASQFEVEARAYIKGGIIPGTDYTDTGQIQHASVSGGTKVTYIGNQTITTSSDIRIKKNIVDTEIDAMGKLNALRVVDFTWNDPSDTSFNNKNARGKYTGFIAQEVIDVLPFCVNAVRDEKTLTPQPNSKLPAIPDILFEDGDVIPEGKKVGDVKEKGIPERDDLWGFEYQYVVPVLVKAVQELSAKNDALETENTALKKRMDALEAKVTALEA